MEYLAALALKQEIEDNSPVLFQSHKLTPEVRDFLKDLRPIDDKVWRKTLWNWINQSKVIPNQKETFLGGNSVTLLTFMEEPFEGKNFDNTIIIGGDFRKRKCRNASFKNAILSDVDFTDCDLSGADFTKINLTNVGFSNECPSCESSHHFG